MLTPLDLLIVALASYRLTRLITTDYVARRPRNWVELHAPGWVGYLATCTWCAGWWVSLATWGAYYADVTAVSWVIVAFAVAGAAGLLNSWERE